MQTFDPNDRRLVRFINRSKEVNQNWAINLIAEVPPEPVKTRIVACDGGGGPLGHPKVYINLVRTMIHSNNTFCLCYHFKNLYLLSNTINFVVHIKKENICLNLYYY